MKSKLANLFLLYLLLLASCTKRNSAADNNNSTNLTQPESVTIGTQVWSTKNLSVVKYRNGDPIPEVRDAIQWKNLTTGAWCWYRHDSATYSSTYGRLYNWYAVTDPRGLAPIGWHIPSSSEWNVLVKYLDNNADTSQTSNTLSTIAGGAMKSNTIWNSPNEGATNSCSFSGLPGGTRYWDGGSFSGIGDIGLWWSSDGPCKVYLQYSNTEVGKGCSNKTYGNSVRLVKD